MDNGLELYHHGVKGMRWGVRRYQNKDGSLTAKGKKRADSKSDSKPDKPKQKKTPQEIFKKAVGIGAKAVLGFAKWKLTDDLFFGGAGQKAIQTAGRLAVTAYLVKFKGATSVRWYDNKPSGWK